MRKLKQIVKKYPEIKTVIFFFSVIVSGILCSAFVSEITINGKLVWKEFYRTFSFWGIVIYSFLLYLYNRLLYRYEKNILKYLDNDYCKAYIVKACLPELIDKYKNDIKSGKASNKFINISEELNKLKK